MATDALINKLRVLIFLSIEKNCKGYTSDHYLLLWILVRYKLSSSSFHSIIVCIKLMFSSSMIECLGLTEMFKNDD